MDSKDQMVKEYYTGQVQKYGRYTILAAVFCLFLPGLYLYFFHGLFPPVDVLFRALLAVWSMFIIIGLIEPIVYYPILGFAGTYMSFLVGNVLNLRVPVSITAQELAGTKPGTVEAEIISTLGIAGSIIASQLLMIVGILALLPFIGKLQESGTALSLAFEHVLPSLFGALCGMFLLKDIKLGMVPISLGIAIASINNKLPYSLVIPPMVIISIIAARLKYKKGWLASEKHTTTSTD